MKPTPRSFIHFNILPLYLPSMFYTSDPALPSLHHLAFLPPYLFNSPPASNYLKHVPISIQLQESPLSLQKTALHPSNPSFVSSPKNIHLHHHLGPLGMKGKAKWQRFGASGKHTARGFYRTFRFRKIDSSEHNIICPWSRRPSSTKSTADCRSSDRIRFGGRPQTMH